jgi:hypothetical protein
MGKQIASAGTTLHGTKMTAEMNRMIMLVARDGNGTGQWWILILLASGNMYGRE